MTARAILAMAAMAWPAAAIEMAAMKMRVTCWGDGGNGEGGGVSDGGCCGKGCPSDKPRSPCFTGDVLTDAPSFTLPSIMLPFAALTHMLPALTLSSPAPPALMHSACTHIAVIHIAFSSDALINCPRTHNPCVQFLHMQHSSHMQCTWR